MKSAFSATTILIGAQALKINTLAQGE